MLVFSATTYLLGNSRGKKTERELKITQSQRLSAEVFKLENEIEQSQKQLKALHESVNQMEYLRLQKERAFDDETNILAKRRNEKLFSSKQQIEQQINQLTQRCKEIQNKSDALEKQYEEKELSLQAEYLRQIDNYEPKIRQLDAAKQNIEKSLSDEQKSFLHERVKALDSFEAKLNSRKSILDKQKSNLQSVINSPVVCNPILAQQFADCLYLSDLKDAEYLINKSRPAYTASEKVREIAAQKRTLQEQCKLQEYQLLLYEIAFPWLADFKEISSEDFQQLASTDTAPDSEYSSLKK